MENEIFQKLLILSENLVSTLETTRKFYAENVEPYDTDICADLIIDEILAEEKLKEFIFKYKL